MDCLVKLYDLPADDLLLQQGFCRQVYPYEKSTVLSWIKSEFGIAWADECAAAFQNQPVSCFIYTVSQKLVGFACYDCTQKNFFGPMGVTPSFQRQGIGKKLLLCSLQAMKFNGYAYAIIGGCGENIDFYIKSVSASIIEGSSPGIYANHLGIKHS